MMTGPNADADPARDHHEQQREKNDLADRIINHKTFTHTHTESED